MATEEHVGAIGSGVNAWNHWRTQNRDKIPDLRGADLRGKDLRSYNLSHAHFENADLRDADLREAELSQAKLKDANLQGADLRDAKPIDITEIRKTKNWALAQYDSDQLKELGLPPEHSERLATSDLSGYKLPGADLRDADLCNTDLGGIDLREANLERAVLKSAVLRRATLSDARLHSATLDGADLREAECRSAKLTGGVRLFGAVLREADFQDAEFSNAKGLEARQFAGANVSGAALPDHIAKFDDLKDAQEASKNTRKLFHILVLACLYCWLTVFTTTDVALLTNASSSPLPIIGSSVATVGFYWVAPLLLLGAYMYFHLYLQRHWEGLAVLPAVFQDGRTLDRVVDPWILNGLVTRYFKRLDDRRPTLFRLQVVVSVIAAWALAPATVALLWFRYHVRQDLLGTAWHLLWLLILSWLALRFFDLARTILRCGHQPANTWRPSKPQAAALFLLLVASSSVSWLRVSGQFQDWTPKADKKMFRCGHQPANTWRPSKPQAAALFLLLVASSSVSWLRVSGQFQDWTPKADLAQKDVSTKPTHWTNDASFSEQVRGADLSRRNLRFANARGAFLAKSNLLFASLAEANLVEADLSGANLVGADLSGANLSVADLSGAGLVGADLGDAILVKADLRDADLSGAGLRDAILSGADLVSRRGPLRGGPLRGKVSNATANRADSRGRQHQNPG